MDQVEFWSRTLFRLREYRHSRVCPIAVPGRHVVFGTTATIRPEVVDLTIRSQTRTYACGLEL